MPNPRLAARYAKSLLDFSVEKGQLEQVYADMQWLQEVCKSSRDFANMLRSPIIKSDVKGKIIRAVTQAHLSELTSAFNQLLVTKNRESYLPVIQNHQSKQDLLFPGVQPAYNPLIFLPDQGSIALLQWLQEKQW